VKNLSFVVKKAILGRQVKPRGFLFLLLVFFLFVLLLLTAFLGGVVLVVDGRYLIGILDLILFLLIVLGGDVFLPLLGELGLLGLLPSLLKLKLRALKQCAG